MPETSAALIDQLVYIDNFINSASEDTPNLDVDGQLLLDLAAFADDSFVFPDEDKRKDNHDDLHDHDHDQNQNQNQNQGHSPHIQNDDFVHLSNSDLSKVESTWFTDEPVPVPASSSSTQTPAPSRPLSSLNERTKMAKLNRVSHYGNTDKRRPTHPDTNVFPPPPPSSSSALQLLQRHQLLLLVTLQDNTPNLSELPKFPVPPGAKSSLQQAGLSQNQIDLLLALIAQHQSSRAGRHQDLQEVQGDFHHQINHQQLEELHNTHDSGIDGASPSLPGPYAIAPTLASHANVETPGSVGSTYSSGGSEVFLGGGSDSASRGGLLVDPDKRKRNTAASARFRIKKKLKEKEMEQKISQLDDLIKNFEIKINELEMENRLLKNLIIEKGNRNSEKELLLLKQKIKHER